MRKYGINNFSITLLEETDNPAEREQFWIKEKNSYVNGYNATLGGEGRTKIDYDLVVATYQKLKSQKEVAKKLNISPDSVSHILQERNVKILDSRDVMKIYYGNHIEMLDKISNTVIETFQSSYDAAKYLIHHGLTNCKLKTIRYHIMEVCNGKRKSAAGFKWQYCQ